MDKKDLIAYSPVRYFDVTNANLKDGEMGLITAKKGLGKGLDSLISKRLDHEMKETVQKKKLQTNLHLFLQIILVKFIMIIFNILISNSKNN